MLARAFCPLLILRHLCKCQDILPNDVIHQRCVSISLKMLFPIVWKGKASHISIWAAIYYYYYFIIIIIIIFVVVFVVVVLRISQMQVKYVTGFNLNSKTITPINLIHPHSEWWHMLSILLEIARLKAELFRYPLGASTKNTRNNLLYARLLKVFTITYTPSQQAI